MKLWVSFCSPCTVSSFHAISNNRLSVLTIFHLIDSPSPPPLFASFLPRRLRYCQQAIPRGVLAVQRLHFDGIDAMSPGSARSFSFHLQSNPIADGVVVREHLLNIDSSRFCCRNFDTARGFRFPNFERGIRVEEYDLRSVDRLLLFIAVERRQRRDNRNPFAILACQSPRSDDNRNRGEQGKRLMYSAS